MVGRREDNLGNILLYDYLLTKRNPVFLNRNLAKALRIHQHMLVHGNLNEFLESNHEFRSRSKWKPPSWDALDAMAESEKTKGTFTLDILGIKPTDTSLGLWTEPIRKCRPLFRLKSRIQVSIWNTASRNACKMKQDPTAEIRGDQDEHGIKISISTRTITVTPDELATDDNSLWKQSIAEAYHMIIAINLAEEDATELFSYIAPHVLSLDEIPCRLSMRYTNILTCPEGPMVYPLRVGDQVLDFGLQASMYWANSSIGDCSILAVHNRDLFQQAYPTPPPLEPNSCRSAVVLTFEYANETITRSSLVCPHEQCRRRAVTNISELRMHLDSWHDNFKYRMIDEGEQEGVQHWRFECDVADHRADQRASDKALEPLDVLVIPPEEVIFDQQKYLDHGIEEFQRLSRFEKPIRQVPIQSFQDAEPIPIRRKKPEEVQSWPALQAKKYRVPRAPPGVTFFRAITKRPLMEGEYISESDDDVDTSWVDLRKLKEIDRDNSLPEPVKRFLKRYDMFMHRERLQDDVHAGDALVRFARENSSWIWGEHLYAEFKTKVDELLEDDIISQEIHAGSLQIVNDQRPVRLEQSSRSGSNELGSIVAQAKSKTDKPSEKGKGKPLFTNDGHMTPQTVDSDKDLEIDDAPKSPQPSDDYCELPFGQCLCGKDASASSTRPSNRISCENIDCIRSTFHVACIVEHWKPARAPDPRSGVWICNDCSAEAGNNVLC